MEYDDDSIDDSCDFEPEPEPRFNLRARWYRFKNRVRGFFTRCDQCNRRHAGGYLSWIIGTPAYAVLKSGVRIDDASKPICMDCLYGCEMTIPNGATVSHVEVYAGTLTIESDLASIGTLVVSNGYKETIGELGPPLTVTNLTPRAETSR